MMKLTTTILLLLMSGTSAEEVSCSCSGGTYTIGTIYNGPTFRLLVGDCYNKEHRELCPAFLKDSELNCWDVSEITDMSSAFKDLPYQVDPIGCWNVGQVTTMKHMFWGNQGFNQPIDSWNVGKVSNLSHMFYSNKAFNQYLGTWASKTTSNNVIATNMFYNSGCSTKQGTPDTEVGPWCQTADQKPNEVVPSTGPSESPSDCSCSGGTYTIGSTYQGASFQTLVANCYHKPDRGSCPIEDFTSESKLNCWDVSEITDMSSAFQGCSEKVDPIGCWNVGQVTNMNNMFRQTQAFNQILHSWDVSQVSYLKAMFRETLAFNQPLNTWNVGKVSQMNEVFFKAKAFNQPLDNWNVGQVSDMTAMFRDVPKFNQPLDSWNVGQVKTMFFLFFAAPLFNQPLDSWQVGKVGNMKYMFQTALAFNQCLGTWASKTLSNVQTVSMFLNSGCTTQGEPDVNGPWCQDKNDECEVPSDVPSDVPSYTPSDVPSKSPSDVPSDTPSNVPNEVLTSSPTPSPTSSPTSSPTPSPTSSPTTLDISPFQVLAVGAGTAESPYGTATGNVGELVIDTFFEASSSDLNDGITIEVYSGVKDDEEDCTQGDLVPKTDYTTKSLPYADYSGPKATSDGVVGIARVTIPDFSTLSSIWFPVKDGVDKDGTIKLCVVTAIKIDYYGTGKDYSVSQLHSKRSISVALVGSIEDGQFKQVIEVTESEATTSESKAVLGVAVETILCNNKNQPVSDDKSYVTGQLFRICVGATSDMVAKGMQVDQYLEVACGERTLFSTEKGTDALTNIDDAKKNNKWAIHSVLTVEDAAAATVTDGTSTFTCRGKVSLSYTSPVVDVRALRNLLPISTGVVVPSSGGAGAEAEAELEGLFDVTIQMETPSMNESSSASPGPASMTTTRTTVVAVMGVVVGSLFSVVSFLLE